MAPARPPGHIHHIGKYKRFQVVIRFLRSDVQGPSAAGFFSPVARTQQTWTGCRAKMPAIAGTRRNMDIVLK
jgi:hypothetical protein